MHKFSRQESAARRLIDDFGDDAVFTRSGVPDESSYPPVVGFGTNFSCRAVQSNFKDGDKDGANVRDGDIKLLVSTEGGFEPENGDDVSWGDRDYSVEYVERIAPAGKVLLFKVRARGA